MIPANPRRSPTVQTCAHAVERLTELAYELLDAHWETSRIASEWGLDQAWQAHLIYLRDLQRVARDLLAHTAQLTAAYDPEDLIRSNHPIPPSAASPQVTDAR